MEKKLCVGISFAIYEESPIKSNMVRTKLTNIFLKRKIEENKKKSYNMQRNYCVSLLQKIKGDYYNNLNEKNICDNAKFWKVLKPLSSSNRIVSNEKITLVEGEEIIKTDQTNAKVLNSFFSNDIKNL